MANDGFTFRRATPADRDAVLSLCSRIWEGDDYIPTCFDRWVADTEGELALCLAAGDGGQPGAGVGPAAGEAPRALPQGPAPGAATGTASRTARAGSRLVGLAKLTWLGPGEAWLEGLRKDPDCGLHGVGKALCGRFLSRLSPLAREGRLCSIRFSTYFSNVESIALNSSLGFREVARASILHREAAPCPAASYAEVEPLRDPGELLRFVEDSGWFEPSPFIHEAWKSYSYSGRRFLERYLEGGSCLGVRRGGRLVAAIARRINVEKDVGSIAFLHAEDDGAAAGLLAEASAFFAAAGVGEMECVLPPGQAGSLAQLRSAGFDSWERLEDYILYEYPLGNLA